MLKTSAKAIANFIAALLVLPAVVMYWISGALDRTKAFSGWSQLFSLLPGLPGEYLRRAFYRFSLAKCGPDSCLCFGTVISHPTASVGRLVYVGPFGALGDVDLGDDVLLGSHVSIVNGCRQHGTERLDIPVREQPGEWPRISIGRDTWIGERAIVMANVGEHCVVAAGAVVTKPVADYAIVAGNPARVIGDRRSKSNDESKLKRAFAAEEKSAALTSVAD